MNEQKVGAITLRHLGHEWKIENFASMLTDVYKGWYRSSNFVVNNNFWCMEMLVGATDEWHSWGLEVRLRRKYCSVAQRVTVTLGLLTADKNIDIKRNNVTDTLNVGEPLMSPLFLVRRSELMDPQNRLQMMPAGALIIFFTLGSEVIADEDSPDEEASLDVESCFTLRRHMQEILEKGIDSDITIRVGDCDFRVHRSVLSARSPVFKKILALGKFHNFRIITMDDCEPSIFRQCLYFMYTGSVLSMTSHNVVALFKAANRLCLQILRKQCVQFLKSKSDLNMVSDVFVPATQQEDETSSAMDLST